MFRSAAIIRANIIVFASSFCVMVIELIAGRILAPYIGVSLYTWTSIIGVILAGIALGNYIGGKVADRYPSYLLLSAIFFVGGLLTILILPALKIVTAGEWFSGLPVMWHFTLVTGFIFLLPAVVLSMISPLVIKLTLADLEHTGGVVGTIYAVSTAGSIFGTFMTGFYLILWFGTSKIVVLLGGILILAGIIVLVFWARGRKWRFSLKNVLLLMTGVWVVLVYVFFWQTRENWVETYTRESNYFAIQVKDYRDDIKLLALDRLIHGYVNPDQPSVLVYKSQQIFSEVLDYFTREDSPLRALHLGGGTYTFSRYMDVARPNSINEVVEIDPLVTEVAHEELGLPMDTKIVTYTQDARLFLLNREPVDKYDIVVGDVFSDKSIPYHLTTLEFNQLVKSHMDEDGFYMINIIDDYSGGRYMPSFIYTLQHVFRNVYLFSCEENPEDIEYSTFVILATDRELNPDDYISFITAGNTRPMTGILYSESELDEYIARSNPLLLIDDHVPTDILVVGLFR